METVYTARCLPLMKIPVMSQWKQTLLIQIRLFLTPLNPTRLNHNFSSLPGTSCSDFHLRVVHFMAKFVSVESYIQICMTTRIPKFQNS